MHLFVLLHFLSVFQKIELESIRVLNVLEEENSALADVDNVVIELPEVRLETNKNSGNKESVLAAAV